MLLVDAYLLARWARMANLRLYIHGTHTLGLSGSLDVPYFMGSK